MNTPRKLSAAALAVVLSLYSGGPLLAQDESAMKNDEAMTDAGAMGMAQPKVEGTLTGANGYTASGTVHLLDAGGKRQLHFTPDFAADQGPDVYVTLANGPTPEEGASLEVARLKRFKGEQTFEVPAQVGATRYSHVVLWSKRQGRAIAHAELHGAGVMEDAMGKHDEMMEHKDGMMAKPHDAMGKDGATAKPDEAMGK